MSSNAFLFRDQAEVRGVSKTTMDQTAELFEYGISPGTYLVLAQGYAFAENAKVTVALQVPDGFDQAEIDFGMNPGGSTVKPFSLTTGATVTPLSPADALTVNRVRFAAITSDAGRPAGVGGISIVALTVDSASIVTLGD